ncbi:hypothetical protein [Sporisorium scitamineum]|uniref:Uncharacterized protein n=1 Tax=Sporisorium scitamineum TaxID=49012 RepID=A0A0F7S506_9BASI|nr:hypothetical protein [Sporisorium scitamineum]
MLIPATESALVECIWRCACSSFPLTPALIPEYTNTVTHPVPGCSEPINVVND